MLLLILTQDSVEAADVCSGVFEPNGDRSLYYSDLYLKLEESLINNQTMLEKLRAGFVSADVIIIFTLGVKVLNGTNDSCPDGDMSYPALCCESNNKCTLCSDLPSLSYGIWTGSQLKLVDDELHVKFLLVWMSFLHGSASSVFLFNFYDRVDIRLLLFNMDLTFEIDRLQCNPPVEMMICALSELLSWVSECES